MTESAVTSIVEKAVRKNPEPKMFSSYDEKVEKYNLKTNWFMYSNIKPPKRGGNRESVSDAKNIFMRAALDKIFSRPGSLREAWRVGVAMFDGGCYLCGKKIYDTKGNLKRGVSVQADHIIPPLLGGTISAGNMAPAHRECNDLKADTLVEEYLKDLPKQLEKVQDFQEMYGYVAPDPELFAATLVTLSDTWDSTVGIVDALAASVRESIVEILTGDVIVEDLEED